MADLRGMSRTLPLMLVSWSTVSGCAVTEDATVRESQSVITPNGLSPQGITLNGLSPQGVTLNGLSPQGLSPQGTAIGVTVTGTPLSGPDLVGSTWTGHLSDGRNLTIRVDAAAQLSGTNSDVWSYQLSGLSDGTSHPLCVDAAGNPGFAITVSGTWNLAEGVPGGGAYRPDTADFTVACRGAVIAKCVEFGYKPWHGIVEQLATCTRAMRADYCGDGTPHTVNGTIINIYDAIGVQLDVAPWVPEAEWTPDGATCVSKKKNTRFDQVAHETPSCYPHALKPEKSCGSGFSEGAAIITELPPQ